MLKRKIIDRLEKWYQSGHYKSPLVFGARQVGKTTAIREFSKAHYDHLIEVNFVKHPMAAKAFDGDLTTRTTAVPLKSADFKTID